ncbi:MAG: hypothetical protein RLZZ450_6357 [Pseudomonadota bacterium]
MELTKTNFTLTRFLVVTGLLLTQQACGADSDPGPERELSSVSSELRARVGDSELTRMSAWLKRRYTADEVAEKFELRNDRFDCIPFASQQSVRDLVAAGLPVALKAGPEMSEDERKAFEQAAGDDDEARPSCPEGHVAQRRIPLTELARFTSLARYLDKYSGAELDPGALEGANNRDYATAGKTVTNYGADSIINIWSPSLEVDGDHSISQIWIGGGSPGTNQRQTVEAGWRKATWLGDSRLFVYSMGGTQTGYNTTGGFVQTSQAVALDSTFAAYSSAGGTQQERRFTIKKEGDNGDWWFGYQGQWIGYWPRSQFASTGLQNRASDYKFGGEVYDIPNANNVHTKTDMGGDGSFASGGNKHAAYQRNLSVYKGDGVSTTLYDASDVTTFLVSSSKCYDMQLFANTANAWRYWIYFGGPGWSSVNCPNAQ